MINRLYAAMKKNIKNKLYGKKKLQTLFKKLYTISIGGMNFGNFDMYENGEMLALQMIKKYFKDDIVIFDVGANCGAYLKNIDSIFPKGTIVHSFEPAKEAFRLLSNISTENVKVEFYNFGFSNECKDAVLYAKTPNGPGSSIFNLNHSDLLSKYDLKEKIKLKTIDSYCNSNDITEIHFLKIDTEGNEFNILSGAKNMLKSGKIKFIQFEFGDRTIFSNTTFFDFLNLFKKNNYKIYRILKDGLLLIDKYYVNEEIYAGVNYLAVHNNYNSFCS